MGALIIRDRLTDARRSINEDRFGATGDAVWVLDGATGLIETPLLPGPSDAAWLVERVDAALAAADAGAAGERLRQAIGIVREAFERDRLRPPIAAYEQPSASLVMVQARADSTIELGNLGDCVLLRRDREGLVRQFGSSAIGAFDQALTALLKDLHARGIRGLEAIWPHLVPHERAIRARMNQPDGYWILDPSGLGIDHLQTTIIDRAQLASVLLLSDGFYRLVDVFHCHDADSLFRAALRDGLAPLRDQLRALEDGDPDCIRFPRVKPHDDATAVLLLPA